MIAFRRVTRPRAASPSRMKHTGDALGFPATGKDVTFEAVILVYWRNGKMFEAHNQFDQLGLLRQLGQETRSVTVD